MRSKPETSGGVKVQDVERAARAAQQRARLLRELVDVLDERYGRKAGDDFDYLPTLDAGFERPIREVVRRLREELLEARMRSRQRFAALSAGVVAGVDEVMLEDREAFGYPAGGQQR